MGSGAIAGAVLVLLAGLTIPSPTESKELAYSATAGCSRSRLLLVPIEWVCDGNVYLIRNNHREYAGSAVDLAPIPKPPPPPSQIDGH